MFMTRAFEPEFRLPERNLCKTVEIVAHSFNTLGGMGTPGACWSVSDAASVSSTISERPCLKTRRVTEHLASTSGLHTHMHECMLVSSPTEHFKSWKNIPCCLSRKKQVQNSIVISISASSTNILSEQNVSRGVLRISKTQGGCGNGALSNSACRQV